MGEVSFKGSLYLSGPDVNDDTYHIFMHKAYELREDGWAVTNPVDALSHEGWSDEQYMRVGLRAITYCDTLYQIRGWEKSRSGFLDLRVALELNMRILRECDDDTCSHIGCDRK